MAKIFGMIFLLCVSLLANANSENSVSVLKLRESFNRISHNYWLILKDIQYVNGQIRTEQKKWIENIPNYEQIIESLKFEGQLLQLNLENTLSECMEENTEFGQCVNEIRNIHKEVNTDIRNISRTILKRQNDVLKCNTNICSQSEQESVDDLVNNYIPSVENRLNDLTQKFSEEKNNLKCCFSKLNFDVIHNCDPIKLKICVLQKIHTRYPYIEKK